MVISVCVSSFSSDDEEGQSELMKELIEYMTILCLLVAFFIALTDAVQSLILRFYLMTEGITLCRLNIDGLVV